MKTFRALLLIVALSVSAYAGNMPNGVADTPPAPTTAAPETGQIETGTASTNSIEEVALSLLQSVLSLI